MNLPISVCIICKNEEKNIEEFLQHIITTMSDYPYEIVIVDTGSSDKTISKILSAYGIAKDNPDIHEITAASPDVQDIITYEGSAAVSPDVQDIITYEGSTAASPDVQDIITYKGPTKYPGVLLNLCHFEWINDFAAARNYSLEQAANDWVLVLDCDEFLESLDLSCFSQISGQYPKGVGVITRNNHQVQNGIDSIYTDEVERVFNRKYFYYEAIIHEQVRFRPEYASLEPYKRVSVPIVTDHRGYVGTADEIKKKVERNNELLFKMLEDNPEDPYIYFQLGQSFNMIHDDEQAAYYYGKGLEYDVDPEAEYVQMMVEAYGYALLHLERYDEALQFENIADIFGKTPEFAVLMGLIYLRKGMLLQAATQFLSATAFDKCRTEGSNSYIPYFNLGLVNEVLGNTEDAIALYQKCGNFPQAIQRIAELEK